MAPTFPLAEQWHRADLLNVLDSPDINVWEEESIMMLFSDGGLFGGHYIEVFIETPENGRSISVGMVE